MSRVNLASKIAVVGSVLVALTSAAAQPQTPDISNIVLGSASAGRIALQQVVRTHRLTVVVFFSATCPCFAIHRERLRDLTRDLSPKGVEFLVVDSERYAAEEARPKVIPGTEVPILRDEGGRLARRLDAQFATESFVFDSTGQLRYRGGIDDQRKYLSPTPRMHLRDALLHLLDGSAPAFAASKALGCALRLM